MRITCHYCEAGLEIPELPDDTAYHIAVHVASTKYLWPSSLSEAGIFVCCEECYPICFDRTQGSVGRLREELKNLARK